jgi:hypothetical protein
MQTPINSRDLALQSTDPRVLSISTNYINLTCPTQQFKYGTDNVAQPASTVVTATLVGILQGTVTFTTTGLSPAPTAVGNTLTINPDNMTGDVVTINASLAAQGTTYQAVPLTLSKIYNQLVAKTTRAIDLLAAYTDGSGYTLPAANNYIELYNGVVKLTSGVVYGPATQTSNGLTATVNTSTGLITLSQTAANTWTGNSESFTFTATRGAVAYSTTYTITKAKAGTGGQQLAEIALYKWSTAQPNAPIAQSTYNWFTQSHTYAGTDWSTTVAAFDGTVGLKLWKITKAITAEALTSVQTYVFSWTSPVTIRQVTTEANELIKTAFPKVYKTALTIPTISGTSRYDWTTGTVVANLPTVGDPSPTAAPAGWSITQPTISPGFTLYQALVSIIDRQAASVTPIDWTTASITPISYAGSSGLSGITAVLTNDTHAIPTDSGDTVRNFSNSGTDLFIYEGATALVYDGDGTGTGKFTVTAAVDGVVAGAATAVTVNAAIGVRYANLTAASFDKASTGSITFTITGRRLTVEPDQTLGTAFSYTVKQSFTKTPSGIQGDPGFAYWIVSSTSVIQKNSAGVFNPLTITFTPKKSSSSTASDYTTGYSIIYRNGVELARTDSNAYTYTIAAGTTSLRYDLYSDSARSNLLDSETVPVVADGVSITGATGISARRAYILVPSAITPAATPATYEPTLAQGYPVSGTWFTTNSNSITWTVNWLATAPNSISEGYTLYQSDGLYNSVTDKTTWNPPYISSLKVGNLAAISVNTGGLTVSDYIKGGSNVVSLDGVSSGDGFYVDSSGNFRVGAGNNASGIPTGARLKFDSSGLKISNAAGVDIFTVVSSSQGAAAESARLAGLSETAAINAAAAAGSVSTVKVQYSTDNSSWHDTYAAGDIYIRSGSKIATATEYTWQTGAKFIPVKGTDYVDGTSGYTVKVQYSTDNANWHDTFAAGDIYIRTGSKLATAADSTYVYQTGTKFVPVKGTDYVDGTSGLTVKVQYSTDNANWHDTYAAGDIYIRSGSKTAGTADSTYVYQTGAKFVPVKGTDYVDGTSGYTVKVQYSTDNSSWHDTFASGDVYLRTGSKLATAADSTYSYSTGAKFIPVKGTDYTDGAPGVRGSLTGYGRQFDIYSTIWSNSLANRVIYNMITGQTATGDLTTYTHLQVGDTVTLTNAATATAAFTRYYIGNSTWADPATIINGDLLVKGTIAADKISANQQFIGHEIRNSSGTFVMNFGTTPYISISV